MVARSEVPIHDSRFDVGDEDEKKKLEELKAEFEPPTKHIN